MIRQLIREMLLQEAMYTPELASHEGLTFTVKRTRIGNGGWKVSCNRGEDEVGYISIVKTIRTGKCLDAYEVTLSDARGVDGLGPLLYDIAMELAVMQHHV